ncbi:MAG TPA: metallophosphoesterase [Steroidobacteraceae bacterium]|nr:metallophosphoesterase [Steroidobacteraceae bacterium]
MDHSRTVFVASFLSGALLVAACSAPTSRPAPAQSAAAGKPVTLLAFGDGGYHYDHLEKEDYETVVTAEQFMAKERADWVEERRPPEEFDAPPTYTLPGNGSVIPATGQMPVSQAMTAYCAQHGCDFGAMLGDNIYPDGAMADAGDAKRFRDVFVTPYGALGRGREDFRIYGVLGNHDWHTSRAGAMAQVRFLENTPPFFMNGLFYRVVPAAARGEVEIFALDTHVMLAGTTVRKAILAEDASEVATDRLERVESWAAPQGEAERSMLHWLETSLANSTARWKIVIGHHPLWSTAGSKFQQAKSLRRLILPTLCRYADMYVAGHEHTLEVHTDNCSEALPGSDVTPLLQVVSGSASKMRPTNSAFIRQQQRAHPELHTLFARGLTWGFAHLTFEGDRVTVRMIETPRDGSGTAQVTYEHAFAHRSSSGPESTP